MKWYDTGISLSKVLSKEFIWFRRNAYYIFVVVIMIVSAFVIIISIILTSGTVVEKQPSSNNSKLSSQHYLWNPQKTTLNGLLQTNHHKMQYNVHSLSISCNRKPLLNKILPKISTQFNSPVLTNMILPQGDRCAMIMENFWVTLKVEAASWSRVESFQDRKIVLIRPLCQELRRDKSLPNLI